MGKRNQNNADLRTRILDAARKLFTLRGADDVTMTEIATEAGVARATVFNQFGSKHALMAGVADRAWAHYRDGLERGLEDRTTPTPVLIRGMFETLGHEIESGRQFYRAVFREMYKLTLGIEEGGSAQASRQDAKDLLFQLIVRGQNRGDLSRAHRPADLITAFRSLIDGTITHWLYDDDSEPLSERMVRAADIFLSSVSATDASAKVNRHLHVLPPSGRTIGKLP